jgi:hypothetical protein
VAEGGSYKLEVSPPDVNVGKGYQAVREEDDLIFSRYRTFFFIEDPEGFSRISGKKIWYQDFKVADESTQPLKTGIPGQWGTRLHLKLTLVDS